MNHPEFDNWEDVVKFFETNGNCAVCKYDNHLWCQKLDGTIYKVG